VGKGGGKGDKLSYYLIVHAEGNRKRGLHNSGVLMLELGEAWGEYWGNSC